MTLPPMKLSVPLLLLALLAAGCDDAFDPFAEGEGRFALVGFLDARQDTQFVRVQPIVAESREARLGEATLTSTALGSGAVRAWEDSLVTLDDGSPGLLFFAVFRPLPGERYRLEAEGETGQETIEVAMPGSDPPGVAPPVEIGGVISQRLRFLTDLRPTDVRVVYTVRLPDGPPVEVAVEDEAQPAFDEPGYDVLVGLSRDAAVVRRALGIEDVDERAVALLGVRVRYVLEDPERAVLEGGLGAIGVAAAFEQGWTLPTGVVEALGYVDAQGEG